MGFIPSRKGSSDLQCRRENKSNGVRRDEMPPLGGDKPHPYIRMPILLPERGIWTLMVLNPASALSIKII